MPQSASDAVRKATGAEPDEQLDHLISLEVGGSNDTSNLNNEKVLPNKMQPSLPYENQIAKLVANGDKTGVSYVQGQKMLARLKGVQLPDDNEFPNSPHPLLRFYPKPNASQQPSATKSSPASVGPISLPITSPANAGSTTAQGPLGKPNTAIEDFITQNPIFQTIAKIKGGTDIITAIRDTYAHPNKLTADDINGIIERRAALIKAGTAPADATKTAVAEIQGGAKGNLVGSKTQASIIGMVNPEADLVDLEQVFKGIAESSNAVKIATLLEKVPGLAKEEIPTLSKALTNIKDPEVVQSVLKSVSGDAKAPAEAAKPIEAVKNFTGESNKGLTPEQSQSLAQATEKGTATAVAKDSKSQALIEARNALEEKSATAKTPPPDGFVQQLKNILTPLKQQGPETQAIFEDYSKKIANARPLANEEARKLTNIPAEGSLDTILRYERGQGTPFTEQIAKQFDSLLTEGRTRGLETPERKNYIPHAYSENSTEIKQVMKDYLVKKGVPESQAEAFLNGTHELPQTTARRLGLNPFFTKTRMFPTYDEAIDAGLHPKYTHPAQLAGLYREQLERNVANRELVADLEKAGKLFPADLAPRGYKPVNLEFSPKGYYAKPRLAQMLNGLFNDSNSKSFFQHVTGITGKVSRFVQKMELTTGIPKTSINVHTIGQLIKDITAGDFKKIAPFIRANSDAASVKYFEENRDAILRMANHGLDLGSTVADYPNLYDNFMRPDLRAAYERGGVKSAAGFLAKETGTTFEHIFTKKNFSSFMPQLYVSTFKDASERFVSQGMSRTEADALAADTVRAFHGLIGNVGRAPGTEDGLSTAFFAPKFRESILNTLWNSLRSLGPEWNNPAFYKNRRLAGGMAFTFGLYTAANKFLNGHYMWQNPSTHQFDLQIPTGNGNYAYIPFMPTFAAVPRNLFGGVLSSVGGDIRGATQQFSTVLSSPLQLFGQLYANKDFYGRPIYNDTDPGTTKGAKIAQYLGLNVIPPFVKETVNYIEKKGQVPLYQALTTGAELPIKYGSDAKNNQSDFYNALDNYNKLHAQAMDQFRPTFQKIQDAVTAGKKDEAQKMVEALSDDEYTLYKDLKSGTTRSATSKAESQFLPTYRTIKDLLTQGKTGEAQARVNALSASDYKIYQSLKKRGM